MGMKRSRARRLERENSTTVRKLFVARPTPVDVTCPDCGTATVIAVPVVPRRRGARVQAEKTCRCGRVLTLTLTSEGAPARGTD